MGAIGPSAPLDGVDLFFDLEALQIVKLSLVALELTVEAVLARVLDTPTRKHLKNAGWGQTCLPQFHHSLDCMWCPAPSE
jgi:hypothetical protein